MRAFLGLTLFLSLCGTAQAQLSVSPNLFAPPPESAEPELIEGVAAVVNDGIVLKSELVAAIATVTQDFRKRGQKVPDAEALQRQVLEKLILAEVQLQLARETGITVTPETVTRSLTTIASRNNLTLGQLRNVLEREGQSFAAFRRDIRQQLIIRRLRQRQVNNRIDITDDELEQYLSKIDSVNSGEEYLVSHILLALPSASSPEQLDRASALAKQIVARSRRGENFAELAAAHSNAPDALQGGSLGWRKMDRVPTIFTKRVASMRKGQTSDAFRTPSGLHVIKLMDLRAEEKVIVTQTLARHILVKTNEVVSDLDAKRKLERLRERVINGEDFASLATGNSDDTSSAIKGGDLGWVNPGQTVSEFEEVMNSLADGDVSQVFHTDFGWHIVQVLKRRQEDKSDTVRRNQARKALMKRRVEEETELWLRRLRDEAFVEIKSS